jgi:hypothetical protein
VAKAPASAKPEAPASAKPAAKKEKPREPSRREAPRREPRRQVDEASPAVQGFGDDVPAFMQLRPRVVSKQRESKA